MKQHVHALREWIKGMEGDPHHAEEGALHRIGLGVIALVFVIFLGWAAWAPLASAIVAPGVIKIESEHHGVQHLEGGIVRQITVREGDLVSEGKVLLELDDTQFKAELEATQGQVLALSAALARLEAEYAGKAEIAFPDGFAQASPQIETLKHDEQALLQARRDGLKGELGILRSRMQHNESQIRGLQEINATKERMRRSLEAEVADLQRLLPGKFISRHKVSQTERQLAEVEGEMAENSASMANLKTQQREIQAQIDYRKADFKTRVAEAISDTRRRLDELEKRQRGLEDRVSRTIIRAPSTGQILGLKVHAPGAVISPGTQIMDIVPADTPLLVEARISPQDIDSVHTNLQADIRLTGFKAATTPVISGRVLTVAGDRLIDERSGQPYFKTQIALNEAGIQQLARLQLRVQPGQPADVMIRTGERTLFAYLLQPLGNALSKAMTEE